MTMMTMMMTMNVDTKTMFHDDDDDEDDNEDDDEDDDDDDDDDERWYQNNVSGTGCEMYTEKLSPTLTGMTFNQASELWSDFS